MEHHGIDHHQKTPLVHAMTTTTLLLWTAEGMEGGKALRSVIALQAEQTTKKVSFARNAAKPTAAVAAQLHVTAQNTGCDPGPENNNETNVKMKTAQQTKPIQNLKKQTKSNM